MVAMNATNNLMQQRRLHMYGKKTIAGLNSMSLALVTFVYIMTTLVITTALKVLR